MLLAALQKNSKALTMVANAKMKGQKTKRNSSQLKCIKKCDVSYHGPYTFRDMLAASSHRALKPANPGTGFDKKNGVLHLCSFSAGTTAETKEVLQDTKIRASKSDLDAPIICGVTVCEYI